MPTQTFDLAHQNVDTPPGVAGRIDTKTGALLPSRTAPPAQTGTTVPATLTSSSLAPTQSFNLTPPAPSTAAAGFQGYMGAGAAQVAQEKAQADASKSDLFTSMLKSDTQSGLTDQLYKDSVDPAKAELTDINNKLVASQHAQQLELQALGSDGALTPSQKAAQTDAINRKYTADQANLSIIQMAKQGKYADAKEIADRAVTAILEKQKNQNAALQFNYQENKDLFTKDEQRAFELNQADRNRALDLQEYQLKAKFDQTIRQNDPQYQATLAATYALANQRNGGTGGAGYNGDFAATIDNVANLETTVAGKKSVADNLKSFIAAGDYKSAYSQIANSVEQGLVGESKQRFANARTDAEVMQGMKNAIQQYSAAGGDMNLLKGTAESIYNKLGTVKDPKFKSLAVGLQREFQTYRNTMTGAAFSPQESAEYQSVNPTGNNTLNLNLSVIDGALSQLNNRVASTIKSRAGDGAVYIKEYADGATSAPTKPLPVGATGTLSSGLTWTIQQ